MPSRRLAAINWKDAANPAHAPQRHCAGWAWTEAEAKNSWSGPFPFEPKDKLISQNMKSRYREASLEILWSWSNELDLIWVWKVDVPCKLDSFQTRLALRRVLLAWCAKTCVETVTGVHGTTCDFRVRSGLLPSRQRKRWGIGILRRGLLQKRDGKEFTKQVHLPCDDVFLFDWSMHQRQILLAQFLLDRLLALSAKTAEATDLCLRLRGFQFGTNVLF